MSVTTSETLSPLGESQAAERRKRLADLALMVFELTSERYQGRKNPMFDGVENADLIDALRACSYYTDQIHCLVFDDSLVVQVEGIDGHSYIAKFSLFGPGISVQAGRVRVTKLPLVGREGQDDVTYNTIDVLEEHSKRLKFGRITTDRAFLIGMSLVISFMDDEEDDPDEDARLEPLSALVMPSDDELREIRAKLPPSTINYDEEGDLPY
jgi:hypothetical protein